MAVAQHKKSKSKSRSRRAQNMKRSVLHLIECSNCSELIRPHRVCPKCGYYKDEQVMEYKFSTN